MRKNSVIARKTLEGCFRNSMQIQYVSRTSSRLAHTVHTMRFLHEALRWAYVWITTLGLLVPQSKFSKLQPKLLAREHSRFLKFHSCNCRFGEGGGNWKIMSQQGGLAGQGSSTTGSKSSLRDRFLRRLRKKPAGKELEDVVSDPNSFTLGPVDEKAKPEHLVVLVNGIAGSALNWEYAAEQFRKRLGDRVVVHCSAANSFWKTLHGVDTMGFRLAEEVMKEVENNRGVTKISFVSHSLGGLISRYAIGLLYAPAGEVSLLEKRSSTADFEAGASGSDQNPAASITHKKDTIAGLQPINFITLATPHLGCRDHQQLPFLCGLIPFEKVAPFVSHWCIGKTGRHLFLADGKGHEPLLKRMVRDCDDLKFLSALRSFENRTAYANVRRDLMVGWRTASIRKKGENPEPLNEGIDSKYPHIVRDEDASEPVPAPTGIKDVMVAGLQQVSWRRVDVNFSNAKPYLSAHDLIQVRLYPSHEDGKDVIDHIIDTHF